MAGFDTTNVAATVGQGVNPFNPMQTVQGLAATQNLLNQNRLFQAQRAVGGAVQGAVNPFTGQVDPGAAGRAIAADPNAAIAAPEALSQMQTYGIQAMQQAQAQQNYARSTLGSLAGSPSLNGGAVDAVIDSMAAAGSIPKDMAATLKAQRPDDPGALKTWIQNGFQLPALGAGPAMEATEPKPTAISTGGNTNLVTTPNIGAPETVGTMVNTPSPGLLTVPTGTGTKIVGVTPSTGQAAQIGAEIPNAASANAPAYQRYNPATKQMETVTVAQAAANPPSGPIGSAPPLGAEQASAAAGQATGAQSGGYFAQIQNAAAGAPAQSASLQELSSLLSDPKVQTGPGSPFLSKINGLAQQFGITPDPKWNTDTSKLDVFNKIATQIAQQQFGVIGGTGTDAKLMSAAHTSPDQMISSISNKDIIPLLKGNAAAAQHIAAAANAWQSAGNDATTGPAFQAALVQHHYNPLVFQTQFMDPAERSKIVSGLDKADQAKYHADYVYALKKGWITP